MSEDSQADINLVLNQRLEAAEVHMTHLMRTIDDLSDQVAQQANDLDRLKARFQMLVERLSKPEEGGENSDVPLLEQRPPHW